MGVGLIVATFECGIEYQSGRGSFTAGITGFGTDIGTVASEIITKLQGTGGLEQSLTTDVFDGLGPSPAPS